MLTKWGDILKPKKTRILYYGKSFITLFPNQKWLCMGRDRDKGETFIKNGFVSINMDDKDLEEYFER